MIPAPRSLSARLARLEAALETVQPLCDLCGYPATAVALVVVREPGESLPTCDACGRPLDPKSRLPLTRQFKVLVCVDDERV